MFRRIHHILSVNWILLTSSTRRIRKIHVVNEESLDPIIDTNSNLEEEDSSSCFWWLPFLYSPKILDGRKSIHENGEYVKVFLNEDRELRNGYWLFIVSLSVSVCTRWPAVLPPYFLWLPRRYLVVVPHATGGETILSCLLVVPLLYSQDRKTYSSQLRYCYC